MKLFIILITLFAAVSAYRWDSHDLPGPSNGGSQGSQGSKPLLVRVDARTLAALNGQSSSSQ